MKKMIWALLCALVCVVLSSCGGGSEAPAPPTTPEEVPEEVAPGEEPEKPEEPGADPGDGEEPAQSCARLEPAANSYYLSPDGDDNADGRTPATAWQSLEKLQSAVGDLQPGDSVLFERSGVFAGGLELDNLKGSASQAITFGGYCQGDAPILSGFKTVSDWQAVGDNVWEATCEDCGELNLLRLDGEPQALARYPNADADDEGYLFFDAYAGRASFSDAELAMTDWTGAEAVTRTRPWVLDRMRVERSQGGKLNLASEATYDFWEGGGYFMQNHEAALDLEGEWTHADGKLKLFLNDDPAERVQVASVDVLVSLNKSEQLVFEDLVLEGANSSLVQGEACHDIRFENVAFAQSGGQGGNLSDCERVEIISSTIHKTFDSGFLFPYCTNCLIQNSQFDTIAMTPGMGGSGNHRYLGVELGGPNSVFEYNRVKDVGYIPVTARSRTTVRYNEIDGFQSVKTDGGGIYTYGSSDIDIHHNIVSNGQGSNVASPWDSTATNGIYIDQGSRDVRVYDNTFAFTSGSGIKLHSAQNITLENNTVFAASEAAIELIEYVEPGKLLNNTVKGNIFVTETAADYLISAPTPGPRAYFDKLGKFSDNRYCAPFANGVVFAPYERQGANQMFLDFGTWRALHTQDEGSSLCNFKFSPYEVNGASGNLVSNAGFTTSVENWFSDLASTTLTNADEQLTVTLGENEIQGNVYTNVGALETDSVYRLRFEAKSPAENASVKVRLRDDDLAPENFWDGVLTAHHVVAIDGDLTSYELFLRPDKDVNNALLWFGLADRDDPVSFDNVELAKVDATPQDFGDKARLELNPTRSAKTMSLDAAYQDLDGKTYAKGSSVRLEPYGSVVLFKQN